MSKSIIHLDREIYNQIRNMLQSETVRLDTIRAIRDKFHYGLGYSKSMCDLVLYTENLDNSLGQNHSFLVTGHHTIIISDHEIVFDTQEQIEPTEDSKVTTQEALSKFVSEVRREKDRNMLSHDSLRRIYLDNFPLSYGEMRHEYYGASVETMFGKYILNWPTDRVKYMIPHKEWNIIKGYCNVLGSAEAINKKIRIIKEIRDSVMECGLAEAKGLFELAYNSVYSGGQYASTEITMIGGKRAMIKYIDVVHE